MPRPLIVALILAVLGAASISTAQRGAGSAGFGHGFSVSFGTRQHSRGFGPGAIFLGDPFYADYAAAPITIPPQYVVVQPPPAAPDTPPEAKSEPLMIELQGNRYVRFGGTRPSAERAVPSDYAEANAATSRLATPPPPQSELPPTVLVFRDGHREEVPEYAIIGSTIYASGDYWQSGHWTKNIQLSALNIPATVTANHDNGVKFILPSSANEVVTRP